MKTYVMCPMCQMTSLTFRGCKIVCDQCNYQESCSDTGLLGRWDPPADPEVRAEQAGMDINRVRQD